MAQAMMIFQMAASVGLILAACQVQFWASQGGTSPRKAVPDEYLVLNERLSIGSDDNPGGTLFGDIRQLAVDREGRIFVADQMAMSISVFSPEGRFVQQIGSRGEGPGEFRDLTAMVVNGSNRLVVADGVNQRLSEFSTKGELLSTSRIDWQQMLWPRSVTVAQDGSLLFVYKLPEKRLKGRLPWPGADFLVHQWSADGATLLSRFGSWQDAYPAGRFSSVISELNPGYAIQLQDGSVAYVPGLFSGSVWMYVKRENTWVSAGTWALPLQGEAVTEHEVPDGQVLYPGDVGGLPDGTRIVNSVFGNTAGVIHSRAAGIVELDSGVVLVFHISDVGGSRCLAIDLFGKSGTHKGQAVVDCGRYPRQARHFAEVEVLASRGNTIYLIDRIDSVVRVFDVALVDDGVAAARRSKRNAHSGRLQLPISHN